MAYLRTSTVDVEPRDGEGVFEELCGVLDAGEVAQWLASPNAWLDDARPPMRKVHPQPLPARGWEERSVAGRVSAAGARKSWPSRQWPQH